MMQPVMLGLHGSGGENGLGAPCRAERRPRRVNGATEPTLVSQTRKTHVSATRLFHFSEDGSIHRFEPRPVRVPSERGPGREWLNGPLVWAVEEDRQAVYLFPRDCPRILLWPTDKTTEADREIWWGERQCRMLAHIEWGWWARLASGTLYRYELPAGPFRPIDGDNWMWVSDTVVEPIERVLIDNLPAALAGEGVELRIMERLGPLREVWATTLHASGIRLRNAVGWS